MVQDSHNTWQLHQVLLWIEWSQLTSSSEVIWNMQLIPPFFFESFCSSGQFFSRLFSSRAILVQPICKIHYLSMTSIYLVQSFYKHKNPKITLPNKFVLTDNSHLKYMKLMHAYAGHDRFASAELLFY